MRIKEAIARIILDSRKEKTIEVSVNGCATSAPEGKSKGKHEKLRYIRSLENDVRDIKNFKLDFEINNFEDLEKVEEIVKGKIGANALFALEASILKALAKEKGIELWQLLNKDAEKFPRLLSNIIGGGAHSSGKKPDFQEFLVTCNHNPSVNEVVNRDVYNEAGKILKELDSKDIMTNDENAWQTSFSNEQVLEIMSEVREDAFEETGMHVDIGIDIAASQLFKNGKYLYANGKAARSKKEQIIYVADLIAKYNLFYVEDPLHEEDFDGFSKLLKITKGKCLICGDDLIVTNLGRLKKAIKMKSINAVIIKPNQIGSLLEVKKVIDLCRENKIFTIMSHRSGETLDDTIADLAFAWQCDFIKIPVIGEERLAKVKRLIEIENSIKE